MLKRASPKAVSPEVEQCWARALLDTDCAYFELGAEVETTQIGLLTWIKSLVRQPAGCVCYGANTGQDVKITRSFDGEIDNLEKRFRELGAAISRIYLPDSLSADEVLSRRGYRRKVEIGFAGSTILDQNDVSVDLIPVSTEKHWTLKRRVHAHGDGFPDGHRYATDRWLQIERTKATTQQMRCYLITYQAKPCGAVATMETRGFTRVKNVYIAPQYRRRGIAAATLREIADRSCGEFGLGAFGIERNAGAELYAAAGLVPVCHQIEWTRPLNTTHHGD